MRCHNKNHHIPHHHKPSTDHLMLEVFDETKNVVALLPADSPDPTTADALRVIRDAVGALFPGYTLKVLRRTASNR